MLKRKYLSTHAWITFQLELGRIGPLFWMLLGEAQSKCHHIASAPLKPDIADALHHLYLAKGVLGTSAIEGNTLTEDEVRRHLEGRLELPKSKEYLRREVDNIIKVCRSIATSMHTDDFVRITVDELKQMNRLVLEGLELADNITPGEIPLHNVTVGRYLGAPREDCDYLLARLCDWLNDTKLFEGEDGWQVAEGIVKAIMAHLYLAWIHPFGDGNGRTARLLEFKILLASGVPTPAAHLLSNFYNETRSKYYLKLDKASKSKDGVGEFFLYAIQGLVDGLHAQLELIQAQQLETAWQNHVHEQFHNKRTAAETRRRHLLLDLSIASGGKAKISSLRTLTPRLAEQYTGKTQKTVSRDLSELEGMGLLARHGDSVRARKELVLQFLPMVRE